MVRYLPDKPDRYRINVLARSPSTKGVCPAEPHEFVPMRLQVSCALTASAVWLITSSKPDGLMTGGSRLARSELRPAAGLRIGSKDSTRLVPPPSGSCEAQVAEACIKRSASYIRLTGARPLGDQLAMWPDQEVCDCRRQPAQFLR